MLIRDTASQLRTTNTKRNSVDEIFKTLYIIISWHCHLRRESLLDKQNINLIIYQRSSSDRSARRDAWERVDATLRTLLGLVVIRRGRYGRKRRPVTPSFYARTDNFSASKKHSLVQESRPSVVGDRLNKKWKSNLVVNASILAIKRK